MMIPEFLSATAIWHRLDGYTDLQVALADLREVAEAVGAKAEHILPDFTDHSVRHMDALWGIAEVVLTPEEIESLSPGEAFILAASFYVHDLGMCAGTTEEGRAQLQQTESYQAALAYQRDSCGLSEEIARECAIKVASRDLHAILAEHIAQDSIPGLHRHLIQSKDLREKWGGMIGQVAASHHWSLREVEDRLGKRGAVPAPMPVSGTIDLGYIACVLRIVDFAHINAGRARLLDRVLRSQVSPGSLMHWQAQEHIVGPTREHLSLVYASATPIESIDGWWTFYDLIKGLEAEIQGVSEYLASRTSSQKRFSLRGVKGASSARQFADFVETKGFEPIDVRFRPDSMERLISLLGGRSLYGEDDFAPLRELLQNASDAVHLRKAGDTAAGLSSTAGSIEVAREQTGNRVSLVVSDDGVGMSERVITNYLLGIASDYWRSPDFFADHPKARQAGFQPVGRFGIGFLSVFMLGDEVQVETQRHLGGDTLQMTLRGIGRRGALQRHAPRLRPGTSVKVALSPAFAGRYTNLHRVVQARAPMLDVPVTIIEGDSRTELSPGWWQKVTQEEFVGFLADHEEISSKGSSIQAPWRRHEIERSLPLNELDRWPGKQPEVVTDRYRVLAAPKGSHILLCSKGFAVATVDVAGLVGLVDDPNLKLTVSRASTLDWDERAFRKTLLADLRSRLQESIARLEDDVNVPARYAFLVAVARSYGADLLVDTSLPWISIVERPGNCILLAPARFQERVRNAREVVVSYGIDSWSIVSSARKYFREASQEALMVPVPAVDQPDIREGESFDDRQKVVRGALRRHFSIRNAPPNESSQPRAILLNIVLTLIAEAWERDVSEVFEAKWLSEYKVLCGHLVR